MEPVLLLKTLQWSYFTPSWTHHQFHCVNTAPGSTETIHYAALPLVPAEVTHILLDHVSPPSLRLLQTTSPGLGKTVHFIFLSSTDPSWRWGKQTMWLLLSNTPTSYCLSLQVSRWLYTTPQYPLIKKCYDSKEIQSACCKQVKHHDSGHSAGQRVNGKSNGSLTHIRAQTHTHSHTASSLSPLILI